MHDGEEESDVIVALRRASENMEVEVMEMRSPRKVTVEATEWRLKAGEAMDLAMCWDLRGEDRRNKAWGHIAEKKGNGW